MSPKVSAEYKERKRQEILLSAMEVFQRKGFEPTTMKDIKEEAGISFGALYSYFSSTEEMFIELLQKSSQLDTLTQHDSATASSWKRLEDYLLVQDEMLKTIKSSLIPAAYEFFMTSWRKTGRLSILKDRYKEAGDQIKAMLADGIKNGEFQPTVPLDSLAKLIVSTLEGLNVSVLFIGYTESGAKEQLVTLIKMLKQLLRVKE
ncbi:TetR family transcriptional regulator [Bacillus sp. FJAT-27231]|uniref:TetR family transcriptional regulator n=1 Tax=Bacillus sp. FJAT-27231 TaxID=1679168 RepID=UPI0006708107|nr:TetR family transcriptional regulator [Bacillus sp. FJAT-27231]